MRNLIEWIIAFLRALFGYPPKPEPASTPVVATPVPPVYAKSSILTRPEKFFFYSLIRAVDGGYAVFAKVRMGDVVYLANEPTDAKKHSNNIQCKHFDFVLCERQFYKPLLVIELDDKSRQWPDSIERDRLKDSICEMANLPMLRVELTGKVIDSNTLRDLIDEKLVSSSTVESINVTDDATPDDIPFSD
jgi:hypothetical protein